MALLLKVLTVILLMSPEALIRPSWMPIPLMERTSTVIESIGPEKARISPATMPLPLSPPCTVATIAPICRP